ncbi:membrane traffic protein [Lithospermum erythrorhizon]|uniref:PRA1 family protein n=1 Tax=Lithospermum erythrorhizon TaxID=34254 RepID=A0AAV3PGQ5_LITER
MAFRANPLSLSVGETELEAWLRETGYLEIVDQGSSSSASSSSSSIITLAVTVLTVNPFSKLRSDDFSGGTPSWSRGGFIGCVESYSFPWSTEQARMRVHENVKRYARNYSSLFLLFFASSLYQMPFAVVGLILSLAIWDTFKFCGDRWGLDQYPLLRQILIRIAQCGQFILVYSYDSYNTLDEEVTKNSYCSYCSDPNLFECANGLPMHPWRQLCCHDFARIIQEVKTNLVNKMGKEENESNTIDHHNH